MSLFTALVPAPAALAHLEVAVAPLRATRRDLRWVRPERWHMTVVFLGDVPEPVVDDLVTGTRAAVAPLPAPVLQVAGVGQFPAPPAPLRVLWAGVRGDTARHVAAVQEVARSCGVVLEHRDHVPHLTLARADRSSRRRSRTGPATGTGTGTGGDPLASYAGPALLVPALHVLRSRPGGAAYEVVARLPLREPPSS